MERRAVLGVKWAVKLQKLLQGGAKQAKAEARRLAAKSVCLHPKCYRAPEVSGLLYLSSVKKGKSAPRDGSKEEPRDS